MVKHQAAMKGGFGSDSFADDDPLAELARIVGFEPVAQPQAPQKIEPAFNLEDELLREFETYRGPTSPIPQAVPEEPIAYAPPEPAIVEPEEVEPEQELAAPTAMPWETDEAEVEPAADPGEPLPLSTEADLASELEWAIAEHEPVAPEAEYEPAVAEAVTVEPASPLAPVPRFSLPLANFSARPQPREPEFFTEPTAVEPVAEKPAQQSLEDVFGAAFDWKPSEPVAEPNLEVPAVEEPAAKAMEAEPEPEAGPVVASGDDPLADLDAFDMGFSDRRAAPAEPEIRRREPDFGLSFADAFAAEEEPAAPAADTVEPSALREAIDGPRGRAHQDEDAFDPFADGDFELSLDDLELDLSDFSLDETPAAAVASVEPPPAPPVAVAPAVSASFVPVASVSAAAPAVAAPVVARSVPFSAEPAVTASASVSAAPVFPTPASSPAAPVSSKPAAYTPEPLPFDASEIAEQDEPPVVIPVLDVPEVPVSEPEQAPTYRAEYDIDLDSELATLFADTAVPEPAPRSAAPAAAAPVAAAAAAPAKATPDDFDAFERALEEDFRETLGQSQARPAAQPARVQLQEDFEPAERSGGRRWLLAASVALIAVLAAGGGYYWLNGSGASGVASGEPPVILADKDPIKMVPENPGGASVPNQDKAVYDRVEGTVGDPQQKSLISGSEEPVDVVQKTLMPETLPLEDENDTLSAQTPVGETEDPRLLPGSDPEQPAAASSEPDAVAITPRKVRTMIVRADGTLVAQEVEAPAEPAPAAASATPSTAPMLAAPSGADAIAEPVAATPPAAPAPVETAAPAAEPVTPVAPEAPAVAEAPAAPTPVEPTADVAVAAPVPATRPAQQPVDIVSTVTDQGNVRPAQQAPAQTAAAPAAEPAQPAAAAPAGGYYVQIASLPSEAEAQKSYQSLSSRYSGVIGGKGVDIKRADIEGKGTYYRVRIPAGTRADAISLCESYKAAGGSCLVAR
ncbi:SPOR domain-containing protein [Pseudomonas sp. R2.Fl]|nr:SPOR domain-containing protein [Pseudomonas sp. R2.Fl]